MAEFTAVLFLGDPFLNQCLNGQAVMGDRPASNDRPADQAPHDSVVRVQTALDRLGYDLGIAGVDGLWGQSTYDAALTFKTALDIRTPDGILDGYVGERTMTALEGIFGVAAFDLAATAVLDLGARTEGASEWSGDVYTVPYERGLVVASPTMVTWPIPSPLSNAWMEQGGPDGLGLPSSDPFVLLDTVSGQAFQEVGLIGSTDGTAVTVPLQVLDELQSGAAGAPTGPPAPLLEGGDVLGLPGSEGVVMWQGDGVAVTVPQAVADRWVADEQAGEPLGAPVSRGIADDGGLIFAFALGGLLMAGVDDLRRADPSLIQLDRFRMLPEPENHLEVAADGSAVQLLLGGTAFFGALSADLDRTTSDGFVYLASWNCEIGLTCLPGGGSLQSKLTTMGQAGVELRMQLWAARPATSALGPVGSVPRVRDAAAAFERWKLEPAVNNPLAVAAVNTIPNGFAFLDDRHARFGSHHQKVVLVHTGSELVAYVGGIEFSRDRVNRTSDGSPLFDTSVRISGPGAQRVLTSYAERWAAHPDGAAHPLTRAGLPSSSTGGTVRVQVGQTYAPGMPFARAIRTASHLTTHAILGARRYFYMEDQYYVGDPQLGAAIKTVLREQPQVMGIVVIAAEDSVTDLLDVGFRRRTFINDIAGQFPGRFLVFEAVGDDGTSTGPRAYVHSKLTLVDDEAFVIGSMNSSRRSWNHDSEIMASLVDLAGPAGIGGAPGFAKATRMAIWAEHLRLMGSAATPLEPLDLSLAAWAAAAAGAPGLAVRPYPPPGSVAPRPLGAGAASDLYWDMFADPS